MPIILSAKRTSIFCSFVSIIPAFNLPETVVPFVSSADTLGSPTKGAIFVQAIAKYMPVWLLQGLTDHAPSKRLAHARYTSQIANGVAKSLIDLKAEALVEGKGSRDVFSLLGTYHPSLLMDFSLTFR